jgi:hypothetical protein
MKRLYQNTAGLKTDGNEIGGFGFSGELLILATYVCFLLAASGVALTPEKLQSRSSRG